MTQVEAVVVAVATISDRSQAAVVAIVGVVKRQAYGIKEKSKYESTQNPIRWGIKFGP